MQDGFLFSTSLKFPLKVFMMGGGGGEGGGGAVSFGDNQW